MEEIVEKYNGLINEETSIEDKFNLSYNLLQKTKVLKIDFRETAYISIANYEEAKRKNLDVIFRKNLY